MAFYFECARIAAYMSMKTGALLSAVLILIPHLAAAGDVTLAWDANTEPELVGYRVCFGMASGQYQTVLDVGNATTYTMKNLDAGTYYFAVKAYGNGVESAFSNEVTATVGAASDPQSSDEQPPQGGSDSSSDNSAASTPDTSPPVISNIIVSGIAYSSATVSWVTDELSSSQIEYGTTAAYGASTSIDAAAVTNHAQNLTGLSAGTLYHYRIKSTDAAGNPAASGDNTFSTTQYPNRELALPRFASGLNRPGEDTMVGLAFVNLSSQPAAMELTAINDNGQSTTGHDIANPVILNLNSRTQLAMIDWEIFGSGLSESYTNGWIKFESATADINGFFLIFDKDLNLLDGANLADSRPANIVFSDIRTDGYNKISVINNNPRSATVDFLLIKADGAVRNTRRRVIESNGSLTADIFADLFVGTAPLGTDYLLVKSSEGVQSFLVMRQASGDIATLEGQDFSAGATTLYAPQYVIGGDYRTSLSVVNLSSRAGTVTFRLIGEDGGQMGSTKTLAIPANGKLLIDDQGFFLNLDPETMTAAYVEIASDGIRLAGSTVFGDRYGQSFVSALALISSLQKSVHFGHVASDSTYFTGIAILNPNPADATVSIEVYAANGTLLCRKNELIGTRQRRSRLLTQFFPALEGKNQTSGYIRLTSTQPIASFALFGTHGLAVLSAIPPH